LELTAEAPRTLEWLVASGFVGIGFGYRLRMTEKSGAIRQADRLLVPFTRKWGIPVLRVGLAVTFVWFGALKVFDVSPVSEMVASTVYFLDPDWFVPTLGWVEVLLGLGLLLRIWLRLVLAVLFAQMIGTFLVFFVLPEVAFQDGNPLLLTTEGEFVVKNMVIIGAAMVVGSRVDEPREVIPPVDE
jgi:uncharacterized membrane protein YkgB